MFTHKLKGKVYYVGVNDRKTHRFEGMWPLPHGVSYNSYLIADESVTLVDTVDIAYCGVFLAKIHDIIGDRPIDYLVINHMEPDHSGSISVLKQKYPDMVIVGNKQTAGMLEGFHGLDCGQNYIVKDGDFLLTGHHKLRFFLTPMVHWPETMMTFDETEGILFSGDGFGCFGALNGGIVDESMNVNSYWDEMVRYYSNIVGKYGSPVQKALAKLSGLPVQMVCSTHGPVWTGSRIQRVVELYNRMSRYETSPGVVIAYATMYGHTEQLAEQLASGLNAAGIKNVIMHCLNTTDASYVLRDIFRYRGLLIGGPTYSGQLYPEVESLLSKISVREVKNHVIGCFGSFTWAGMAVKRTQAWGETLRQNDFLPQAVELKQGCIEETLDACRELAQAMATRIGTEDAKAG